MKPDMEVDRGLSHVVYGDPDPLKRGTAPSPNFVSMSLVVRWSPFSATAEHLLRFLVVMRVPVDLLLCNGKNCRIL